MKKLLLFIALLAPTTHAEAMFTPVGRLISSAALVGVKRVPQRTFMNRGGRAVRNFKDDIKQHASDPIFMLCWGFIAGEILGEIYNRVTK